MAIPNYSHPVVLISIIYICIFLAACGSATTRTISDDQSTLLAFRAHITFDPQNILANNWSTNSSPCKWLGISCGLRHKRVTALNISNLGLKGTISPYLGNLSFLTSLDLNSNSFHGFLPKELARLRRLKEVCLQNNYFTGEIPSWLGKLEQLQYLYLFKNSFTGSIPSAIFNISASREIGLGGNNLSGSLPVDICNHLPKLEFLSLSRNNISGQIPSNLYKCRELQVLSLSYNGFSGNIPREIGNLTMLRILYLGGNNWKDSMIPLEMGNLKHLEILSIGISSLTGHVPPFIFNMSSLKLIDLGDNKLSGNLPMDDNIPFNLPNLEELDLRTNQLTGQIPLSLWKCKGLRVLWLRENKFTGSISKQVGNLTLLQSLALSYNNFKGTLPDEIGHLNNLVEFTIYNNSLTGSVPFKLFNISTLKMLDLSSNQFSGHLPSTMGLWLPNLEMLFTSYNRFGGTIPSSLSNASMLTIISMVNNSLIGSIPNTLGNLRFLQRLYLAENFLTRETSSLELQFFTSLTNCGYLEVLELSYNQLNGILPTSIGNISSSLNLFYARGCKIKGHIPIGIGNLSNLQALVLDGNELTGPIPTTVERLNNLEHLDFSNNRLQGPIPNEVCNLQRMGELYLSNNMLYGIMPACFGDLKTLQRLNLDSNKLTSSIPLELSRLAHLVSLNLSSNLLSGDLPSSFGNFMVVTEIDLSWNQLSGSIPSTIGGAQELSYLSLAHNKLHGSIPESFGKLKGLEFLDLSNNNVSGRIPKSLETLKYLNYLNLSFNMLQGEIPTGGNFANFTPQSFMQNLALCGSPRLQVPECKTLTLGRGSKIVPLLKYLLPCIISAILLGASLYVLIRFCRRNKNVPNWTDSSLFAWRRISYYELVRATESFGEINLLGVGSYGSVFKGTFSNGINVAVKVFNMQLEGAIKSFDVECKILSKIRHRNLVRIISGCISSDFKALVLEYMPNGSLEKWLYSHNYCLDILARLNIMTDVALALEYLHHGHPEPIVHCDLKPSNVLLDEHMTAHVCDFGIAKLLGEEDLMAQTKTLATIGYMAPEYGSEGIVSTKGDVYSYGVMLMEVFTRKKPTDELFSSEMSLRSWVNEALHGSVLQVVDINLLGSWDENLSTKQLCLSSILGLALDCSKDSPAERITMEDVVVRLEKIKSMLIQVTR